MSPKSIPNVLTGLILIGLGLTFGLIQILDIDIWSFSWPFIIIGVGGVFLLAMLMGGKSAAGLAVPGAVISTVGLILLYQNTFGHWESWSYAWTLIVTAIGAGIWMLGLRTGSANDRRAGLRLAGTGLVLFFIFAAFFEVELRFFGLFRLGDVFWPLAMIALGLYILFVRSGLIKGKSFPDSQEQHPTS